MTQLELVARALIDADYKRLPAVVVAQIVLEAIDAQSMEDWLDELEAKHVSEQ